VRLAAGTYVCVEVNGQWHGIEPEICRGFSSRFSPTKDKSHRGLGLALVYGIVTNHGGGVAVSSQSGMGTSAAGILSCRVRAISRIRTKKSAPISIIRHN